jgi:hypothetical protein
MIEQARPQPRRLLVQWRSNRVDQLDLTRSHMHDADRVELREMARQLSDSSQQIVRVWLEDRDGRLMYAAERGRSMTRNANPIREGGE